ncbi:MAG: YqgE/AlgH family protein [Acidimicrobiia bacterium]
MKNFPNNRLTFTPVCRFRKWTGGAALLLLNCIIGSVSIAAAAENLTGQLLVATPQMSDSRFSQAVIYMVRHDQNGAMGLVVNRPIARGPIADLLKSLGVDTAEAKGEITLHYGGPVEPDKGLMLHGDDYRLDSTIMVRDGIALTGDVELLRAISLGKGPRRNLLVMGHAGWAPSQLEAEIETGVWFSIPAEEELIFGKDSENKWDKAMDKRKINL